MSKQSSPFAALTSRERQERCLEFQIAKLPYTQGNVDASRSEAVAARHQELPREEPAKRSAPPQRADALEKSEPPARPTERAPEAVAPQKPSHRHYDAILKRMDDASRQLNGFQRWE